MLDCDPGREMLPVFLRGVICSCPWRCIFDVVIAWHMFCDDSDLVLGFFCQYQSRSQTRYASSIELISRMKLSRGVGNCTQSQRYLFLPWRSLQGSWWVESIWITKEKSVDNEQETLACVRLYIVLNSIELILADINPCTARGIQSGKLRRWNNLGKFSDAYWTMSTDVIHKTRLFTNDREVFLVGSLKIGELEAESGKPAAEWSGKLT